VCVRRRCHASAGAQASWRSGRFAAAMTIVVHAWIRSRDHFLKKNLKKMVPLRTDFVKGRIPLQSVDGSRRLPLLQNWLNDPTHWAAGVGFPCEHADHRRSSRCGGDTTVCAANQCVFRVTSLQLFAYPSTLFTVGGMRLLAMAYDSSIKPRSPYRCRNVSRNVSSSPDGRRTQFVN
jgi:hypothetical protein